MNGDWTGDDPFGQHDPAAGSLPGDDDLDLGGSDGHLYHGHGGPEPEPFPPDRPDGGPVGGPVGSPADLAGAPEPWPDPVGGDVAPLAEHPGGALPADLGHLTQLDRADTLPQHVDSSPFPAYLEVDVTPADGLHWVDPQLLGEPEPPGPQPPPGTGTATAIGGALHDLRAAEGGDPASSEDPAIRALARFWADPS